MASPLGLLGRLPVEILEEIFSYLPGEYWLYPAEMWGPKVASILASMQVRATSLNIKVNSQNELQLVTGLLERNHGLRSLQLDLRGEGLELTNELFYKLKNLRNLNGLKLTGNFLYTGYKLALCNAIRDLTALKRLDLLGAMTMFDKDDIIDILENCTKLQKLTLPYAPFNGMLNYIKDDLKELTCIGTDQSNTADFGGNVASLEKLRLYTGFAGHQLTPLALMPNLRELELGVCYKYQARPEGSNVFCRCGNEYSCTTKGNHFCNRESVQMSGGPIVRHFFSYWPQLTRMTLKIHFGFDEPVQLNDLMDSMVRNCPSLESLRLVIRSNMFSRIQDNGGDQTPGRTLGFQRLKLLNLHLDSGNAYIRLDHYLNVFQRCPSVQVLELTNYPCMFIRDIPYPFPNLITLRFIEAKDSLKLKPGWAEDLKSYVDNFEHIIQPPTDDFKLDSGWCLPR